MSLHAAPSPAARWMRRCTALAGLLILAVWSAAPTVAQFQPERPRIVNYRPMAAKAVPSLDEICTLHFGPPNAKTRLSPARSMRGKAVTANIEVEYNGFPDEAQTAFQRAVDIWETHIQSDVTIKVVANYTTEDDPNVLASAGPFSLWFGITDDGVESIYTDALIEALLGENAVEGDDDPSNDDNPDIVAQFSNQINWYFGPPDDPGPAAGQFDFTTVVLHELGHGLGFIGSMTVNDSETQGSWGFGTSNPAVPAIYDRFTENGTGTALIDTSRFPNPSPALANVLTSNDVFFSGPESDAGAAAAAAGPLQPKLYLPSEWSGGSSYSHLDESTYLSGAPNSLMTPQIGGNEIVHQPGSITCGMFADMGWLLGSGCMAYFRPVVGFEVVDASSQDAMLIWTETSVDEADDIVRYIVERQYFDEPPTTRTIPSEGAMRYTVPLDDLDVGTYTFRLFYVRTDDEPVRVGEVETTVPLEQSFELAEIYPNPFSTQANIKLTVRSAQDFRVEVYNALGQLVAVLYDRRRPANDPRPITFDAARLGTLPSGRYFFRVIGRNFEETRSAVFVR